ncbi:MAG: XdhC family protein [Tepidisphaeraceae bacterium]
MVELFDEIHKRCARGERVALCTVIAARGSTPQQRGARMLVTSAGQILGTLGGGCVEAEVRQRALKQLHAGGSESEPVMSFRLDHDHGWDDGMWCGGILDVHVQLLGGSAAAETFGAIARSLRSGESARVAIPEIGFEETLMPAPPLLIAGAGHVAEALATLASTLGFAVTVFDDRADALTERRFPRAKRVVGTIDLELARHAIDRHTFIVVVTRGHHRDAAALAGVIQSPARYIGMIGSKRKVRTILGSLAEQGVDRETLARVHAPIGLEIGAVSVEEIAVSIAAELIAVRREETRRLGEPMQLSRQELDRWIDRDAPR